MVLSVGKSHDQLTFWRPILRGSHHGRCKGAAAGEGFRQSEIRQFYAIESIFNFITDQNIFGLNISAAKSKKAWKLVAHCLALASCCSGKVRPSHGALYSKTRSESRTCE